MCSYVGHVRGPCTAKTTEPQVNRFGLCTRVGPGNHVLNGVPDTPREGELQGGGMYTTLMDASSLCCSQTQSIARSAGLHIAAMRSVSTVTVVTFCCTALCCHGLSNDSPEVTFAV